MNMGFLPVLAVPRALLLIWLGWPLLALSAQPQMTAEELLTRVAERAKQQKSLPPPREFIRTKTTLELDKKHNIKEREELSYRMVIIDGALYPRLLRKNGRALTPDEQRKEQEKEAAFRQDREKGVKPEEGNTVLFKISEDAAKRFDYAIIGQEQINGRPAHIVTVIPKPGLRAKTIEEQVMRQISGRLWIDETEYEIARLELRLGQPVHFGVVGVLGGLHGFDFCVYRSRRPEGDWENSLVKVWLQFRVLLDTTRIRYEEKISPLPPDESGGQATSPFPELPPASDRR